MKKILLLFTFSCLLPVISFSQSVNWQWARGSTGSNSYDEGNSVATDISGNVYVSGFFQSSKIIFGTDTLISAGGADIYLVKYSPTGNVLWAKRAGGISSDYENGMALDASGNIYLTGSYVSPTITFGTYTLTCPNADRIFLVKYSPSGNVIWAKSAGGNTGTDQARSVSVGSSNHIFITGGFYSPKCVFGSDTLFNSGNQDLFIAKYDSAGTVLWVKNAIGASEDIGTSVTTDSQDNVFITGYSQSSVLTFGSTIIYNTNSSSDAAFLAKYNSAGNCVWAKNSQGAGVTYGYGVTTDFSGNSIITGIFENTPTISFGTDTIHNTVASTADIFITKYDSAGTVSWARSAGGQGNDRAYSLIADSVGNIFIAGGYSFPGNNPITFGTITLPFPTGGVDPMFIAKYDKTGHPLCAFSELSGGDDNLGLAIDKKGNLYTSGDYMANPFIIGSDTLRLTGNESIFTAKFDYTCIVSDIKEKKDKNEVAIYPNPSTGKYTLSVTENANISIRYNVYSPQGKLVAEQKNIFVLPDSSIQLDLSNLDNGIYLLSVQVGELNKKFKLLLLK
jgi:hypothetical protein